MITDIRKHECGWEAWITSPEYRGWAPLPYTRSASGKEVMKGLLENPKVELRLTANQVLAVARIP